MENVSALDIATRFSENPLITLADLKPSCNEMVVVSLLNTAVFRFEKKTWLLIRVTERPEQTEGHITVPVYNESGDIETIQFSKTDPHLDFSDPQLIHYKGDDFLTTLSHLRLMCSDDGREFYVAENYSAIFGEGEFEAYGIEDCRVTEVNGIFYLTYTMASGHGTAVGLMQTRDWRRFERRGMILPPHNKDCVIFDEKIRDRFYAFHGAGGSGNRDGNNIWLAESPDSIHWGNHKCIASTRADMWDSARVSAGCSPIETPQGWLTIYQGADDHGRVCLGALLLSIREPSVVIGRSETPLMEPTDAYESESPTHDAIFTNGHLVVGDKLKLYYSAGGQVICGAELSIQEILATLKKV